MEDTLNTKFLGLQTHRVKFEETYWRNH